MTDDLTPAVPEPQPPTQVRHSWRATLRTVLQYVLAVVVALPVIIPGILEATDGTPLKKYVAIAAGYILVAIGVITKIMAIPMVDRWLTTIGIGAAPSPGKHEA